MLPAVTITLPPATTALLARVQAWPKALTHAVIAALDYQNEITVGHIQRKRATGTGPFPPSQGKLGVITNRYRLSLRPSKAVVNGTSILSSIGTNVRYAGAHEFGFDGTVAVKAHSRRIFGGGRDAQTVMVEKVKYLLRNGAIVENRTSRKRKVSGVVQVKAHQLKMHIPERAPIRRGIEDRVSLYTSALSKAVVSALSSGKDH